MQPDDKDANRLFPIKDGHGNLNLLNAGGFVDFDRTLPGFAGHRHIEFWFPLMAPVCGLRKEGDFCAIRTGEKPLGNRVGSFAFEKLGGWVLREGAYKRIQNRCGFPFFLGHGGGLR